MNREDGPDAGPWPEVTVVIPTRERPELLRTALAAALDQDYPGPVRCVVVYDGTEPDRSLESTRPGREVSVTVNSRRPGLAGARNTGILLAEGDLVAFCDDDDRWLPDKLRRQVAVLLAEPSTRFVCCGIRIRYADRTVERCLTSPRVSYRDLLRSRLTELHPSTFLIRREALLGELGLVDEDLPGSYAEDYELLLRAARTAPVRNLPTAHVEVLWHPRSYFTGRWPVISSALRMLVDRYPEFGRERRGGARVYGQIAFAEAAGGHRREALRWSARALRLDPREPRAVLAVGVAAGLASPERVVRTLNSRGRGI